MKAVPVLVSAHQRHNVLVRHYGAESPEVAQARRALDLARTEETIRRAIEQAPPLDAETVARIHALIPATEAVQQHAAERAIDDPAKLAKAARIVRLALEHRVLTEDDIRPSGGANDAA